MTSRPSPNALATEAYSFAQPGATLGQLRAGMDAMIPQPGPDVAAASAVVGGVAGTWFGAPGADERVVLHLHGGGFAMGSSRSHADLAARMSVASGARVFVPDYRLAPEHPFPAALDDAQVVYRGLLAGGADPRRLAVSGDSSGGGLALALLTSLRDAGDGLPRSAVLLSPFADFTFSGESMTTNASSDPTISAEGLGAFASLYLGGADTRDPLVSPLFGDLGGLPPLLVQVGSLEILLSDAIRVVEAVDDAGGAAELQVGYGMFHVYQQFAADLPRAARAIERIGTFLDQGLGG